MDITQRLASQERILGVLLEAAQAVSQLGRQMPVRLREDADGDREEEPRDGRREPRVARRVRDDAREVGARGDAPYEEPGCGRGCV